MLYCCLCYWKPWMDQGMCVIFATDVCPNSSVVLKILQKPKWKGQGLLFQGLHTWLCSENSSPSTEKVRMIVEMVNWLWITILNIIGTNNTTVQMTTMTDPANHLKDGCKIHKMVHVLPSEKIKKVWPWENVEFPQHIKEIINSCCVWVALCLFTQLLVLVDATWQKNY